MVNLEKSSEKDPGHWGDYTCQRIGEIIIMIKMFTMLLYNLYFTDAATRFIAVNALSNIQ